jgi:hypothetical protein
MALVLLSLSVTALLTRVDIAAAENSCVLGMTAPQYMLIKAIYEDFGGHAMAE